MKLHVWENKNNALVFLFVVIVLLGVEEYISERKDGLLVDPDPNSLYTKRKLARQGASCAVVDSSSVDVPKQKLKFPESGWGSQLEKMPLFTRAEMNKYIENSGKRLGSSHHSVPTSWRKGKTFLEDEYLKNIECPSDEKHFYSPCKCYHSFRKNDEPHNLKLAMCIVSGDVVEST